MRCQDVRDALAARGAGELALTEWAILQTHLRACSGCRQELGRAQVTVGERARAKRRRAIRVSLVATALLLVVAGGGLYVYQSGLPGLAHWDTVRPPPSGTAPLPSQAAPPAAPAPDPPAPDPPAPVAPELVAPGSTPPSVPPKAIVEPAPGAPLLPPAAPAPEPAPRPTRPAATLGVPPEDRMPTQARPPAALSAPPGAEAMPTQAPSRPGPRVR